ncbi:glycosyltransferase family 4 protein [Variovorax sp. Varisp85]|uniref:glycosyltransferase family 4 protein n=1 Tax=Variovorax sp. Varisp85 TaxID=3243059 RepID=UPI0039A705B3
MKILVPIIGFGTAGGYRVLSELANHWLRDGHQVDFLVDERSSDPYFPTSAKICRFDRQGRLLSHQAGERRTEFSSNGNAASIYFGMWRALRRIASGYDVILANHSLTAFPVAFSKARKASKYYYVQAYEPEYYALEKGRKARVLEWLSMLSYRLNLKQIANAPIYIDYRDISAQHWIPPGVDESIFHRRSFISDFTLRKPLVIGTIGRKEASKGTRYVLEAFEKLALIDPDVQLKVAFGNLPENWKHDRAKIVVPNGDHELADYYRSVDILIAPGTVQLGACHYPVLEAMSCGTPVITTGYLPASKENSWIVPVADSDAIVSSVLEISSSSRIDVLKKLDLAAEAISSFHWKNVSRRFIDLFECR